MDTAVEESLVRGIAIGEERGKREGKLEIARAMAAKGLDTETIRSITGLETW